jgi:thiol-disulfide isomerase/thioredoxin
MSDEEALRVVCLCAAWCGVCRDYRATFDAAAADAPATTRFAWIDIEDDAELLDDVDVEDFPTLLIAKGDRTLFFGTITPQPATLARLLRSAHAGEFAARADAPEVDALVARLHAADG